MELDLVNEEVYLNCWAFAFKEQKKKEKSEKICTSHKNHNAVHISNCSSCICLQITNIEGCIVWRKS